MAAIPSREHDKAKIDSWMEDQLKKFRNRHGQDIRQQIERIQVCDQERALAIFGGIK
jgi:hypothetical protein